MKAYLATTGTLFALIVLVHGWRAAAEGVAVAREPVYLVTTGLAVALTIWAWRLWRGLARVN